MAKEAIVLLNSEKVARAKRRVKAKGGNPENEKEVFEEYKILAGPYKIEEVKRAPKPKKEKKKKKKKK